MNEQHRTQLESMGRAVEKIADNAKDMELVAMLGLLTLEVAKLRWTLEELAEVNGKKVDDI